MFWLRNKTFFYLMRHSYLKAFTDIVHTLRGREKALARLSSLVWAAACLSDTCLHLICFFYHYQVINAVYAKKKQMLLSGPTVNMFVV